MMVCTGLDGVGLQWPLISERRSQFVCLLLYIMYLYVFPVNQKGLGNEHSVLLPGSR